jgi:uncharacterized protein
MFIDIHKLELNPLDFDEEFRPQVIDLGEDIRQQAPLKSRGRAELVQEHHGKHEKLKDIRLHGDFSTTLETICARCLEPVVTPVARSFDLLYRPQGSDGGQEERAIGGTEAEIGYYQGNGMELEDALREQLLLAVPLKMVCREDCRGLCPTCGANLNLSICDCTRPMKDQRWSALEEIKKKLSP